MSKIHFPLEQELWHDWIEYKSDYAANELISHYMYLVHFHVERISSHLPKTVQKEDVKSLGLMGLYDALKKFEPSRDLKFDTYASIRIRGAIIDGLRKEDWLPRSLRDKVKKVEKTYQKLEQEYHRSPTVEEIAKYMGQSTKEVEVLMKDSIYANVLSIEEKSKSNNVEKEGIGYTVPGDTAVLPESQLVKKEMEIELVQGIKELNHNEQLVISLFYFDELTLTEIGQVLNLTTSRISQIHKKAILKLKNTLSKVQDVGNHRV